MPQGQQTLSGVTSLSCDDSNEGPLQELRALEALVGQAESEHILRATVDKYFSIESLRFLYEDPSLTDVADSVLDVSEASDNGSSQKSSRGRTTRLVRAVATGCLFFFPWLQ